MSVHIPRGFGLIAVLLATCTGCVSGRGFPVPPDRFADSGLAPSCADPDELARKSCFAASRDPSLGLAIAATALDRARWGERSGYADCVDDYYEAAAFSWDAMNRTEPIQWNPVYRCSWQTYHASLTGLIVAGQRFGRLQPSGCLVINRPSALRIPIQHVASPWSPSDFGALIVPREADDRHLARVHRRSGLGLPLIAERGDGGGASPRSQFLPERMSFAVTAVLRPDVDALVGRPTVSGTAGPTLEFIDPLHVAVTEMGSSRIALASDISAPLGRMSAESNSSAWLGFINPGATSDADKGLRFLEPYQPGKIPVVFVHGLLSDPLTWINTVNDLWADPLITERYQFWAFKYPTGQGFLKSATEMRDDCQAALAACDPAGTDPALHKMVLISHSMGGLVSKLQVTDSGTAMWNLVSPFPPEIVIPDVNAQRVVYSRVFFEPQPFVRRVVFIGVPHGGSSFASRIVGRIGGALVETPDEDKDLLRRVVGRNPEAFSPMVRSGLPTSVDMLRPDNPVLLALRGLPVDRSVHVHSIIGTGRTMLLGGPADGVVPVDSARHAGAESELYVPTTHSKLHGHPDTVQEIRRILRVHLQEP